MSRCLLRIAPLLVLFFVLLIASIRARGYDAESVEAVFGSLGGCQPETELTAESVPCWQGIRVGVTTRAEALALLHQHPWVGEVFEGAQHISWRWSGSQPALFDGSQYGLLGFGGGVVQQVRLQTRVAFGDIWTLFSSPAAMLLVRPARNTAYQIVSYERPQGAVQVISSLSCPVKLARFWASTTTLSLGEVWTTEALNGRPSDLYTQTNWWQRLFYCRP
ncbi:MAG: hypothetical protein SNJ59_04005 [Aggregatilineales bacterium]